MQQKHNTQYFLKNWCIVNNTNKNMNKTIPSLFSVVIPAYNRANIIKRTIDSVLSQTFKDYEIIIIDDGSSDNLKEICDNYNNTKIKYIYQENAGSNPARNNGIKNSCGTFISFLDSDDAWDCEYLSEVYKKFKNDEQVGAVWVKHLKIYLPGGKKKFKKCKKLRGYVYKEVLKQGFLVNSSSITARRSLLNDIGGWDNNLKACQDDDICFRLAKQSKIDYVDKALSTFYIDDRIDRISGSSSRRAWNSFYLWKKHAEDVLLLCGEKELIKKIKSVYTRFFLISDLEGINQCEQFLKENIKNSNFNIKAFRKNIYLSLLNVYLKLRKIIGK